jgi:transcriptional regulator with XRE-family HTH domain
VSSELSSEPATSYREAVGRTLHRLRADRGWTLRLLSERSGLSVAFLSEIERGLKEPSGSVLTQLAAAFGISLADLLGAVARALTETASPQELIPERLPPDLRAALVTLDEAELAELARYAAYLRWRKESAGG